MSPLKQQVAGEEVTLEADPLWIWDNLPKQPLLGFLIHKIVSKITFLFQATKFHGKRWHGHK